MQFSAKYLQNNRLAHPLWKLVTPPVRKILDPLLLLFRVFHGWAEMHKVFEAHFRIIYLVLLKAYFEQLPRLLLN